ncbi:P-loop containing nucleoside triphosphate hydrolase protein [Amylostereum chailletii]|nr:P-loop containing nucleoside triphosphate hydrolase protein [Amylostereum chailletii]
MPPRKGIVRSGNAGNSSKSGPSKKDSKKDFWSSDFGAGPPPDATKTEAKPLFPVGSKYPFSLLQERCQKNGWERPNVDTRKRDDGWCFVVTLSRLVQKSSGQERESVRMEPHPPYFCPSAVEARQWGATYALYRFCNGIQLNRVLPPGPRDYWNVLAAEHKVTEEHLKWMYAGDPFAARKSVEERQAKAVQKKEDARPGSQAQEAAAMKEFSNEIEVKMSTELRELVEDAIRQEVSQHPEAQDNSSLVLSEMQVPDLIKQLQTLGFKLPQARKAVTYLSEPSSFTSNLLRSASPLDACIEYLILHLPEVDLPARFLPANNSSNTFVTGVHGQKDDISKRWIEDWAVKQAGWPAHVVRECTADPRILSDWALLIAALNRRLMGADWRSILGSPPKEVDIGDEISEEEIESMGASWTEDSIVVLPLFTAPLQLNFVIPPNYYYNRSSRPPPMYITSTSTPAYIRLHLLSHLLTAFKNGVILENGWGICIGAMQVVEEQWAIIEDQGAPDINLVMRHLMPRKVAEDEDDEGPAEATQARSSKKKGGFRRQDLRTDAAVKSEFEALQRTAKYQDMLKTRERLPAFSSKDEFLRLLEQSRVVVVVGETGSGKTTQLPQFILDSLIWGKQGAGANILVTQPRRISAISVAARVSAERCSDGSVGYTIRGESKQTEKTKLLFCTTGVVLRRLSTGDSLGDVTHVIVDEVHERSVDGDFLLLELKELLAHHPTLKVILMSATINHETFIKYFDGAPLLSIPGFTHPVQDMREANSYLEDIFSEIDYRPTMSKQGGRKRDDDLGGELTSAGIDERTASALKAISRADRIDYQLVTAAVNHIISKAKARGGILIFLPGVQEIRQCVESLKSTLSSSGVTIFPLHANLSSEEQRAVFGTVHNWKIVVATNVAETSITIDDIVYVVDAGKVKETQYDPQTGLTKLEETWVTRAAARQRRGRAGRTQPGICYKLYTRAQERKMFPFPKPEIQRVPLESIALTVKSTRETEDVKEFLGRAIDPPEVAAMDKALSVLEELGAIDEEGQLTALGRHMAVLPLDLRLGKMLILATIFQCLDPILTVAACLSSKPVFLNPMDRRDEATKARANFATEKSDLLTDVHAYDECLRLRSEGRTAGFVKNFCEENFISASTIRDVSALRQDLFAAISSIGLVPSSSKPSTLSLNTHSASTPLLKAVILASLYPRVSRIALPRGALKFDQTAAGTVQRENTAKEYRVNDMKGERVWIHPASVLFRESSWQSGIVVSFLRVATGKVFLRDVTEVPLYALFLFGGHISVNHIGGGLTIGGREGRIKLKAWPRIGILVQQLRRLLDAQLMRSVESGSVLDVGKNNPVVKAMLALLAGDGLTPK